MAPLNGLRVYISEKLVGGVEVELINFVVEGS